MLNHLNTEKMKKLVLVAILAVAGIAFAAAQPRAIGLRLGWGGQVSYEHGLGNNMLSIEAGVPNFDGIEAAVTYDWIDPFGAAVPWSKRGEWHWYLGVGAGAGMWGWGHWRHGVAEHWYDSYVGVAGRVGIEYDFWFPLQLSLDFRPIVGPHFHTIYDDHGNSHTDTHFMGVAGDERALGHWVGAIALGVRYKF